MSKASFSNTPYYETTCRFNPDYAGYKPMPYPPNDLWCVKVISADPKAPQAIVVALHQDIYNADWVVHEMTDPEGRYFMANPPVGDYFLCGLFPEGVQERSTCTPVHIEAGQDVTGIEDPMDSYRRFVERCAQEYEALAKIFRFVQVDAERSIYEQHQTVRKLFKTAEKRPWAEWNVEAVLDWVARKKKIVEAKLA